MAHHNRKGKVCDKSIHTEADEISLNIYQNTVGEKISLCSVCYSLGVRDTKDSRHVKCFDLKIKQHLGGGATHWDTHAKEDLEGLGKQTIITKEK
jgi:hypothetical protein